jgi:hypothetical protein
MIYELVESLGYGLDHRRIRVGFQVKERELYLFHEVQIGSGLTHSPIERVEGTVSAGIKRQGPEADS